MNMLFRGSARRGWGLSIVPALSTQRCPTRSASPRYLRVQAELIQVVPNGINAFLQESASAPPR
jgi:hypothetical protein